MDDNLRELQEVFFGEADQLLEDLESSLMKLESSGFNDELVNKIFRLAHNFKGSSRSVGFTTLADLAHKAEDLLTKLKSKELDVTAEITTALLQTTDALRSGLTQLKSDRGASFDHSDLISTLVELLGVNASGTNDAPTDFSQGFGFFDDEPATGPGAPVPKMNSSPKETPKAVLKVVPTK
jgi:two-component system chemotaxis sensor kinase CheA